MKHSTTVTDVTATRGYGPLGHGVWLVTCSCGFRQFVSTGARNRARRVEADHIGWGAFVKGL